MEQEQSSVLRGTRTRAQVKTALNATQSVSILPRADITTHVGLEVESNVVKTVFDF
jgi:hypothetical protein